MSPHFHELLFRSSPEGIMLFGPDLAITAWNPGMEKLLGIAAEEAVGHRLDGPPLPELLTGNADTLFREALRGNPVTTSSIHLAGGAAYHFFEITSFPLRDEAGDIVGGAAVFRQTGLQPQPKKLSSRTYVQFQNVLESMADAFVALDTQWCYTYVNRKAAATFNRTQEYLIGKHIWTEFPEGIGQPFYHAYYRSVAERRDITLEEYYPPYDRWFENRIYPLADGLAIFFSDVTDRKREKLALEQLNRELLASQQLLQAQAAQINGYNQRLEKTVARRTGELEIKHQELAAANEELGAANEELTTLNEELRASNEQLALAKGEVERLSAEAIRTSEQKYAELTESMQEVFVVLDGEQRYTYLNKAAERMAGQPRESVYGKTPTMLFGELRGGRFENLHRRAAKTRKAVTITEELGAGGQARHLELTAYPTASGGTFGIARDVTARVQAEQQYRELAESINDPVVLLDKDLRYLYMNTAAELAGNTPGREIGEADPERVQVLQTAVRSVLENGRKEVFTDEVTRGPVRSSLEITLYPTKAGNVLMISRDVTEQVRAQERERELNRELVYQNEQLQQFGYITSHTIRGPVATLLGLLSLLDRAGTLAGENATLIDGMEQTVNKLDLVIRDLNTILEYKKTINAIKEKVSLAQLAEEVRQLLARFLEDAGAALHLDFARLPEVFSVRSYLHSIFYNLLSNAIKFRDPTRPLTIEVRSWPEAGYACISFADNGLGMDLDLHGYYLFGLYKRFHGQVEGKGLGLHLVKTQAEALSGTIGAESREGVGTTFTLRLRV
jgi:PAS domain S-box-containing protein